MELVTTPELRAELKHKFSYIVDLPWSHVGQGVFKRMSGETFKVEQLNGSIFTAAVNNLPGLLHDIDVLLNHINELNKVIQEMPFEVTDDFDDDDDSIAHDDVTLNIRDMTKSDLIDAIHRGVERYYYDVKRKENL